jgi:hypothetical protein
MKRFLFSLVFLTVSLGLFAQNETSQNELKINMSNLIGFKWLDVGYERILNEESSIGIGTLISLDHSVDGLDEYRTFSLTPYYRHFFSNNYAQGFFVEAFTMLHSGEDEVYYSNSGPYDTVSKDKYTDFAVGISVGAKWVTTRGFVAEIYAGIGRDMFNQSDIEVVGRGGVSIGYRFQ